MGLENDKNDLIQKNEISQFREKNSFRSQTN